MKRVPEEFIRIKTEKGIMDYNTDYYELEEIGDLYRVFVLTIVEHRGEWVDSRRLVDIVPKKVVEIIRR